MIEIFTPYLLVLLSWNDLSPSATMQMSQELYISEEVCQQAGAERLKLIEADRAERLERFKVEQIKTEASKFFCIRQTRNIRKYRPLQDGN